MVGRQMLLSWCLLEQSYRTLLATSSTGRWHSVWLFESLPSRLCSSQLRREILPQKVLTAYCCLQCHAEGCCKNLKVLNVSRYLDELGCTSAEPSGGHKIQSIWRQKLRKWANYIEWDLTELDQSEATVTKTGELTFLYQHRTWYFLLEYVFWLRLRIKIRRQGKRPREDCHGKRIGKLALQTITAYIITAMVKLIPTECSTSLTLC